MYDEDDDGVISEKDLFEPLLCYGSELYAEVYTQDLPKMLNQLHAKVERSNALTFKDFAASFCDYPAILIDIIRYVAGININKKTVSKKDLNDVGVIKNKESKEDIRVREEAEKMLQNNEVTNKVINTFKLLAENPNNSLGKMYITLYSLTNGFVRFESTVGESIWVYE